MKIAIVVPPRSAARRSQTRSSPSRPASAARSETYRPRAQLVAGSTVPLTSTRSQLPAAFRRLPQPGSPCSMSWRMRARTSAEGAVRAAARRPLECPRRQELREVRRPGLVGVHVAGRRATLVARCLDQAERIARLAEVAAARCLEVRHLDGDAQGCPDLQGLRDRRQHLVRLVADVRGVQRAGPGERLPHRHDLFGSRPLTRRVRKPCRHPPRTRVERLAQPVAHAFDLAGRRPPVGHAHRHRPQRRVADERQAIDGRPSGIEDVEILVERCPAPAQVGSGAQLVVDQLLAPVRGRRERGRRIPAVADELGGDSLHHLVGRIRKRRKREVRMRMEVDETRCEREAARIEDAAAVGSRERRADGRDPPRRHQHIRTRRRHTGPVEDRGATDQKVRRRRLRRLVGVGHGRPAAEVTVCRPAPVSAPPRRRAPPPRAGAGRRRRREAPRPGRP